MTTKTAATTKTTHDDIATITLTGLVVGHSVPKNQSLYSINQNVIAPKVECGFVASDYNSRSYTARSCHNAAAWAESWNGIHQGALRCHRHRAIDERTARRSQYRVAKTYICFDARSEAEFAWRSYRDVAEAARLDAIHDKVKECAQYLLNHVATTAQGQQGLDGTTLRVLRNLTDDDVRFVYVVK